MGYQASLNLFNMHELPHDYIQLTLTHTKDQADEGKGDECVNFAAR